MVDFRKIMGKKISKIPLRKLLDQEKLCLWLFHAKTISGNTFDTNCAFCSDQPWTSIATHMVGQITSDLISSYYQKIFSTCITETIWGAYLNIYFLSRKLTWHISSKGTIGIDRLSFLNFLIIDGESINGLCHFNAVRLV